MRRLLFAEALSKSYGLKVHSFEKQLKVAQVSAK